MARRSKVFGSSRAKKSTLPQAATRLMLKHMRREYEAGNVAMAREAIQFCASHQIEPPAWVSAAVVSVLDSWVRGDGLEQPRKTGRPTQHCWVTLLHIWAVKECEHLPYGRGDQAGKYDRAARLLQRINPKVFAGLPVVASASAIKTSHLRFMRRGKLGQMNSAEALDLMTRLCKGVDPARIKAANEQISVITKRVADIATRSSSEQNPA